MLKTLHGTIAPRENLPLAFRFGHLLTPPPQPGGPSPVVALAPLTMNLPAAEITGKITQLLRLETARRPLVLSLSPHGAPFASTDWLTAPPHLNGEFALSHLLDTSKPKADWLEATLGDTAEELVALQSFLRHAREHYAHILLLASAELKADALCRVRDLEREQAEAAPKRFSVLRFLNSHFNYFAPGNILDNLMRSVHGAQIRVAEEACRQSDVVLRPLACDGQWHEFSKPEKYISLGRLAALEQLDEIRKLVRGKETHESADTAQSRMAVAA